MITSRLMLCAEGVVRDSESNNISVYNILERIQPAGFPVFIQRLFVLAFLDRLPTDPERFECVVRVTIGEVELTSLPGRVNFQGRTVARWIIQLQGLVIPNPGVLSITLLSGGQRLSSYNIDVGVVPPSLTTPPQAPPPTGSSS